MQLRNWNWEHQRFDVIDYPDALIEPFVNWLLETHAWHEDVELVHRRVRALRTALANHRQQLAQQAAAVSFDMSGSNTAPASVPIDEKRARNLANLAKAREARKAKLAAAKGQPA